jgi:hypothetical protein
MFVIFLEHLRTDCWMCYLPGCLCVWRKFLCSFFSPLLNLRLISLVTISHGTVLMFLVFWTSEIFFYGSGSRSLDPYSDFTDPDRIWILPISQQLITRTIFLNITLLIKSFHEGKSVLMVTKGRKYTSVRLRITNLAQYPVRYKF